MSETDQCIAQEQDTLIWDVLQTLRDLPDWTMAARDPDCICAAFSPAIPDFQSGQLILHAWTKVKVRELNDIMFVLEHFVPVHKTLKQQ